MAIDIQSSFVGLTVLIVCCCLIFSLLSVDVVLICVYCFYALGFSVDFRLCWFVFVDFSSKSFERSIFCVEHFFVRIRASGASCV